MTACVTARDCFVLSELNKAADGANVLVNGPLAPFSNSLNPAFDALAYRQVIRAMKAKLQEAAGEEWRIIQHSRAWEEMSTLALDWCELRLVLLKLEFAGMARRLHLVGLVDTQQAWSVLKDLEERTNS